MDFNTVAWKMRWHLVTIDLSWFCVGSACRDNVKCSNGEQPSFQISILLHWKYGGILWQLICVDVVLEALAEMTWSFQTANPNSFVNFKTCALNMHLVTIDVRWFSAGNAKRDDVIFQLASPNFFINSITFVLKMLWHLETIDLRWWCVGSTCRDDVICSTGESELLYKLQYFCIENAVASRDNWFALILCWKRWPRWRDLPTGNSQLICQCEYVCIENAVGSCDNWFALMLCWKRLPRWRDLLNRQAPTSL